MKNLKMFKGLFFVFSLVLVFMTSCLKSKDQLVSLDDYIACVQACDDKFSGPDLTTCITGCRYIESYGNVMVVLNGSLNGDPSSENGATIEGENAEILFKGFEDEYEITHNTDGQIVFMRPGNATPDVTISCGCFQGSGSCESVIVGNRIKCFRGSCSTGCVANIIIGRDADIFIQ